MRLFYPPRSVRVQATPEDQPARLLWRGHWEATRVSNSWRLEDDWWQPAQEQVKREYFRVVTASGTVLSLFRDDARGGWYVEKVLD